MVPALFKASAPGTMMFLGEHAVLYHKQAIVFSVNHRVSVTLNPRLDSKVVIQSALGNYEKDLQEIQVEKPLQFVLAACLHFKEKLPSGFELTISADFKDNLGLGSSAAVTVATVAVLLKWLENEPNIDKNIEFTQNNKALQTIFLISKSIIQSVQGIGSGADVAASVYGGVLVYQTNPPYILKQLSVGFPLTVIYSGFKTPTTAVIQKVSELNHQYAELYKALFNAIDLCVKTAIPFIETESWKSLGDILNIQQGLMNALGVGTSLLNAIVDKLLSFSSIYGAKISGSGLGDCVVGLGKISRDETTMILDAFKSHSIKEISLDVSRQGLIYE